MAYMQKYLSINLVYSENVSGAQFNHVKLKISLYCAMKPRYIFLAYI